MITVDKITKGAYTIQGLTNGSGTGIKVYLNESDLKELDYKLSQLLIKEKIKNGAV